MSESDGTFQTWPIKLTMSALEGILLQKSFGGDERNFLGPLMRFVRRDVRDLIAHQKNGHEASYRRHRALQRWSRAKFGFREIFSVVRFSTFATLSAKSGLMHCSKIQPHSITSSASCWRCSGISRPSALAVLRLMISSNLVGVWIGRSAGFAPLRMRSVYSAAGRNCAAKSLP